MSGALCSRQRKGLHDNALAGRQHTLNEAHQTDFTTEDKVDFENIYQKVRQHDGLQQVINADNSETNKRRKFDDVIDEILLSFVNSKLELYTKLSKSSNPEVNTDLKRQLYQAYLEQSPPILI